MNVLINTLVYSLINIPITLNTTSSKMYTNAEKC